MQAKFRYAIKFVADMDKAVAFYQSAFGLKPRYTSPLWSEFETGEVTLALQPASDANPAGGLQLGFAVPDLPGVREAYEARSFDTPVEPGEDRGTLLARILSARDAELGWGRG